MTEVRQGMSSDKPVEKSTLGRWYESAQKRAEGLATYDEVLDYIKNYYKDSVWEKLPLSLEKELPKLLKEEGYHTPSYWGSQKGRNIKTFPKEMLEKLPDMFSEWMTKKYWKPFKGADGKIY